MTLTAARPTILLVEDSDDDAFFFRRALNKCRLEHDLIHFSDGASAVEFLEKLFRGGGETQAPKHLFLDLKLPVMSGFELLEWLSNRFAEKKNLLQVSILSGSDSAVDMSHARHLGVSDYFVKPVTPALLKARLQGALSAESPPRDGSPA